MPKLSQSRINTNYNKLVVIFLIIATIIIIFTAYFAFSKTVIFITPEELNAEVNLEISVSDLDGQILETTAENSYQYTDLATTADAQEDYANGTVVIYNNYVADQQLVATTRLLSQEGVLFRTQEDVIVPQGGSIEVSVQADEKGEQGNINPSTFEIVALNTSKKEFIYAKSEKAMTGGLRSIIVVSENDIAKAKTAAIDYMKDKVLEEFSQKIADVDRKNISIQVTKEEVDVNAGDQADNINIDITANFTYSTFSKEKLIEACQDLLSKKNTDNYNVIMNNKKKDLEYNTENKYGKEIIIANCKGKKIIKDSAPILDKTKMTNKTAEQVKQYLENFAEVQSVEVKISPFWVKTTPFIKENIKIEINEI
jgi:hypothetical protein